MWMFNLGLNPGYVFNMFFYHSNMLDDDDDDELFLWYGWPTKGI